MGSGNLILTTPPLPLPVPLALILPVTCKLPGPWVPALRLIVPPVPLEARELTSICVPSATRLRAALTETVPPLPVAPAPDCAESLTCPAPPPRLTSPIVLEVVVRLTVPPLPVPEPLAVTLSAAAPPDRTCVPVILTRPPAKLPPPAFALTLLPLTKLTGPSVELRVISPPLPPAALTVRLVVFVTTMPPDRGLASEFLSKTRIMPPCPPAGPDDAESVPLTPFVTAPAPIVKGVAVGLLLDKMMQPPLPVPRPLASRESVTYKF